jgi:hypothetical protein
MSDARHFGHRQLGQVRHQVTIGGARKSSLALGVVILAGLALGALAIVGWRQLPPMQDFTALLPSDEGPNFTGKRVGRAATAPLLKMCVTNEMLELAPGADPDPGTLLEILNAAGTAASLKPVFGSRVRRSGARLAMMWGLVADCVYKQNGWQLCDIDNRALAVNAAGAFLRQADLAEKAKAEGSEIQDDDLREIGRMRDRVLDTLRLHARNGVLIASDFGTFAPAVVWRVLKANQPDRNDCEKH